MAWFSKQNKNKIEFFTDHEELLKFKPQAAARFFPDWFKKMRPTHEVKPNNKFPFGISEKLPLSNVNATVKRCPGIISYLSEGYVLPLWSDIVVQSRGDNLYAFGANATGQVSMHSRDMHFNTMPVSDEYHKNALKFINPWKVKTAPGWSVMISAPFYHFEDRFEVLPGVVDSDVYHHIHVNTLVRKQDGDMQLSMGMPFVHIIPFQRESTDMECRVSTEEDKKLIENLRFRMDRFFAKNKMIKEGGGE